MSDSCVELECGSSINYHPEPSTLIVKLFHWHQCARENKSFVICEQAKVCSIWISREVNMQGNQRTKHREVRGSRPVEHCRISPTYRTNTLCQSTTFYDTSTIVQLSKMSCQNQDRLHSFENNLRVLLWPTVSCQTQSQKKRARMLISDLQKITQATQTINAPKCVDHKQ